MAQDSQIMYHQLAYWIGKRGQKTREAWEGFKEKLDEEEKEVCHPVRRKAGTGRRGGGRWPRRCLQTERTSETGPVQGHQGLRGGGRVSDDGSGGGPAHEPAARPLVGQPAGGAGAEALGQEPPGA